MSVRVIVVAVDDSLGSRAAIAWAADLATDLGARVILLHVFEPLAHLAGLEPGVDMVALRERADQILRGELCEPLRQRGLVYEAEVREGDPSGTVTTFALEVAADLIVVGARRMSQIKRLLIGSTATHIVQFAPCPVTVVHANAHPG